MSLRGAALVRDASRWSAPIAGMAARTPTDTAATPSRIESFRNRMVGDCLLVFGGPWCTSEPAVGVLYAGSGGGDHYRRNEHLHARQMYAVCTRRALAYE